MASLASPAVAGSHGGGGSSATVLEFVCLFTHDLRRKQKRWQDGRLKYHTFNKRVMVYDDRGNFVGDMYWRRDWEFDEGEEIELERGGVIVQVAECVGRQNQDLSELIDKRAKEKEQRAAARPAAFPVPMHTPLSINRTPVAQRDHFQTRHRPLNQLLGTPTGHHGRAVVPTESPYEQRHAADRTPDEESSSRAQKRRRYDDMPSSKMGYAQALFGAPLTLSGAPMSSAPIRRPAPSRPQSRIDLTSSQEDGVSNSRPVEITEEQGHRTGRPSPVSETRPAPRRVEQPNRAPVTRPQVQKRPVQKDMETQPRNEGTEDVIQRTDHSTSRRGVSSHFSNTSEETQKRASLLKSAGLSRVQPRQPTPVVVEKRADEPVQVPNQRLPKSRQPEPITIPDDEENEGDYGEFPELEEEPLPVSGRQQNTKRPTKSGRESEKRTAQDERNVGRTTELFKSNSFAHSTTDTESEALRTRAPAPVPPREVSPVAAQSVEVPEKESRTELRIKSRGRRGLLVMAEMAKEAPVKKKRKKRAPTPEIPVETGLGEQYDIPDQDLLDLPDRELPQVNSPKPDAPKGCLPNEHHFDPDDVDPFASLEPAADKGTANTTHVAVPANADDSDPFASPEPVVRKRPKLASRREQARAKQIVNDSSMDMEDDDGLPTLRNSSPEIMERPKRTSRAKAKPRDTVYDIPEDTKEEQTFLPQREKSPPEPKKRGNTRERNTRRAGRESAEEDAASDQESEDLPRARRTRTGKRRAQRSPGKEKDSDASSKNKRAAPALPFSDEPSSEEEVPKPPPKMPKTTKAPKTSKAAKPKRAPRLGGKLKSTVKSREVFGFVMSSSPPPPVLGGAPVSPNLNRPAPVSGGSLAQADNSSAPVSNGNGHANGGDRTSMAASGHPEADSAPDGLASFGVPSLQSEPVIVPAKDPEPPGAVATSSISASRGAPSRQRIDASDRAGTATNEGPRNQATIATEGTCDDRVPLPPVTGASALGAEKSPAVCQPGQPVLRKQTSEGLCNVGSGTRAPGSASHSNVRDPVMVPPQTRSRQTITASAGPEKPSTAAPEDGGAILPPPPDPPSRPAPPAQTRPQAPVPMTSVTPTTTSTARGAAAAPPPPPPVSTITAPTIQTTTVTTTPSVSTSAVASGTSTAAMASPALVTAPAPANAPAPTNAPANANVPPRIQNPASRGRKAALKSDAKGQTPQSILPPPEPLADRSNLVANRAVARPGSTGAGGQEERPKLKMTFPGFVSAREGGPWSREAHDLLGGGRPV